MQLNMTLEDITVTKYIEIITRKTADLFSAGTRVATILAEAPEDRLETTGYFGHHLGLAFQIIDDYLDLVGDENTGKPRGIDVKEGTPTLPVIRARYQMDDKDAQRLIAIYNKKKRTDKDVSKVLKLVGSSDGLQYTKNMARERADLAIKELEKLPENNYIDLLKKVTDFVVERDQ